MPHKVHGDVQCSNNNLSVIGAEYAQIGGKFSCFHCNLKNTIGFPKHVGGTINLSHNKLLQISNLPSKIYGNLWLYNNDIKSIVNMNIEQVVGSLAIYNNKNLKSVQGLPKVIGRNLDIHGIKGITEQQITQICDVRGKLMI